MPGGALLVDEVCVAGVVAVDVVVARVHAATSAARGGLASTNPPAFRRNPLRSTGDGRRRMLVPFLALGPPMRPHRLHSCTGCIGQVASRARNIRPRPVWAGREAI